MLSTLVHIIRDIRAFFEGDGWAVLVTVALLLSVLFWTICLIGIAFFYYRDYRYRNVYSRIYPALRDFIYEQILVNNRASHFPVDKLGLDLHNKLVGNVVRHIIHEFIFTVGGEKGQSLRRLFNELGFDKEAQYEIRHSAANMVTTVGSLANLALMKVPIQEKILDQLLKSPQVEIRVAASKYLLQVEGEQAFDRVFEGLIGISQLQALDIFQTVVQGDYYGNYMFSQWLNVSKSFAVNSLFMDLMVYYQELNEAGLWALITANKESKTALKAINSLGKLLAKDSEERLQDLYTEESSLAAKLEILKALGRVGQGKSIDFLNRLFMDSNLPLSLRKHAYRSLVAQRPYSIPLLRKIDEQVDRVESKLIRYVNHPMVHYI
ncbi:HEAT repeat domain-containing protein [Sphingobacterium sp. DR205]|uniref:HEAT repeat domain-containing protein n=1 Tax=Sphingobacterium sp. DR205 TaxID=2713573 RepID=UPI0013E4EAEF|nr:HEAT repeat domain-containing protein [Sphingobacterium sp. DR205]QIH32707.1 HEAT repeat domain-containing protein [Sphingobacterium sp. DR205]